LLVLGADVYATTLEGVTARMLIDQATHEHSKWKDSVKLLTLGEWCRDMQLEAGEWLPIIRSLEIKKVRGEKKHKSENSWRYIMSVYDLATLSEDESEAELFGRQRSNKRETTAAQRAKLFAVLKADSERLIKKKKDHDENPYQTPKEIVVEGKDLQEAFDESQQGGDPSQLKDKLKEKLSSMAWEDAKKEAQRDHILEAIKGEAKPKKDEL